MEGGKMELYKKDFIFCLSTYLQMERERESFKFIVLMRTVMIEMVMNVESKAFWP